MVRLRLAVARLGLSAVVAPTLLLAAAAAQAGAQDYFGRNKVQYESFDWRIVKSDHFDNFFYPPESTIVRDAARMAERWYSRHSDTFRHAFDRKSLIFYADQPDFEQTNVVSEQIEEGTGGVTESNRTRVIMPFDGIYADNDHVLGHELVHVFQYNIAEGTPGGGLMRLDALPLWLIEGMAEYFSLGREDPLTAMWMRDAVQRNKFPTIKQLTTDPRFFPYRYGQALWAYVGGRWGDRAIVEVYRTALRLGWDAALVRVLGENQDSLSKDWAAANRAMFLPQIAGRTHPDSVAPKARGASAEQRLQPRADDQSRRQAVRLLLEPESVHDRPLHGRRAHRQDHQETRRTGERPALRRDQFRELGGRLVAGRQQVRVHRLRRRRPARSRFSTRSRPTSSGASSCRASAP